MSKTVKDILTEPMVGPSPGWSIDDAEADAIITDLDAAGFVIVSKDVRQDAVIRTAVNDALEQAAKRAEDPTCTYIPGYIRMLKYVDLK